MSAESFRRLVPTRPRGDRESHADWATAWGQTFLGLFFSLDRRMKLKQDPDDFQVEELTDVRPGPEGPFAFYRLDKRGWSTPDAHFGNSASLAD